MADAVLRFVIEVDDDGTATIKEFGDEAETATDKAEGGFSKLGKTLQANAKALLAASAAITAVGGVVVKMAADFDTGLREVNTLLNLSEEGFADLKDAVVSIDPALGNTQELTEGLYNTISAGISDPVEAIGFLEQASVAAKAGVADLGVSVEAGTKVLQGFSAQGVTSGDVFDKLFTTVALGQTKFDDLANVAGGLAATASNLNINIDELFGSLAQVTLTAGSTAQASTQLEAVMSSLITPTERMSEVLGRLGDGTAESAIANVGFVEVLKEISAESGGSSLALGELFGRKEAMAGFLSLGAKGFDDVSGKIADMADSAGAAQRAFEEQQKSAGAAFDRLRNTLERVAIQLGSVILPIVADVADKIAGLAQRFTELGPGTQKAIVAFGAIAAALTGIAGTIGLIIGPLGAVGGALLGAGKAAVGLIGALNPTVAVLLGVAAATAAVTAALVAYMDHSSRAAAEASNMAQVVDSVRVAIRFNQEQLAQWVGELDNTTRAMVRQRAETLLAGTLTDELRAKYEGIIAALDEYEAEQDAAGVATVDTSAALAGLNEAAAAAAGGIATATTATTELDEAMSAFGFTTLAQVNTELANFATVAADGSVPVSQLVGQLDEMIASYTDLDLLTPEVTAEIQEQIRVLQEQGAELTRAQIAMLPYEEGLRAAAEANAELARKAAEARDRIRESLAAQAGDLKKYDEAVGASQEVSTEFYVTLSETGPPKTGLQQLSQAIFGVKDSADQTKSSTDSMFGGILDGIGGIFGIDIGGMLGGFMEKFSGIGGGILSSITGVLGGGGEGGGLGGILSGIFGGAGKESGSGFLSGLGSILGLGGGGGTGGLMSEAGATGGSGFLSGLTGILGGGGEGGGIGGFFSGLFGGGGGGGGGGLGGMLSGLLGGLGGTGGGGFLGGLSGVLGAAANFIPIVGPFISAFAGPLIKGIGKLGGVIGGAFKSLFGGPDRAKQATDAAKEIGATISAGLADKIVADAKRLGEQHGNTIFSRIVNSREMLAEAGTLSDQTFGLFATRALENFNIAADGVIPIQEALATATGLVGDLSGQVGGNAQRWDELQAVIHNVTGRVKDGTLSAADANKFYADTFPILEQVSAQFGEAGAATMQHLAEITGQTASATETAVQETTAAAVTMTETAAAAMGETTTTALASVAEQADVTSQSIAESMAEGSAQGATAVAENMQAASAAVSNTLQIAETEATETARTIEGEFSKIDINVPVRFDVESPDLGDFGGGGGKGIGEGEEEIPRFAKGGFVRRPTLGIVGEAGPEFVVPKDRVGAFVSAMGGGGSSLGGVTININGAKDPAATGAAVKTALEGLMRQRARSIGRRRQR